MFSLILLICSLLIKNFFAFPISDLVNVTELPGLPNYNLTLYSGYLNITQTKKLHYVFIPSQNNPSTDPVILWLNGGPGCSSMLGLLYENGPFVFPDGWLELQANNYSWVNFSNMLYLEAPAGVGYSYAGTPEDYIFNDSTCAYDNLQAVLLWYSLYPEYLENDLYIAGESYAGVYVPFLAVYLHDYNQQQQFNSSYIPINLKGIMVGNACTNYEFDCNPADKDMYWNHALYSPQTRAKMNTYCPLDEESVECSEATNEMLQMVLNINQLDIYRDCYFNETGYLANQNFVYPRFLLKYFQENYPSLLKNLGNLDCTDSYGGTVWLNKPEVREALHILNSSYIPQWQECNDWVANNYTVGWKNGSFWAYPILIQNNYKILVYSGDTDGCVPTIGTIRWIQQLRENMGLAVIQPWKSWTLDVWLVNGWNSQVAGFYEVYQGLTFVTVKGVGHLVPQWARPQAYKIITYFLDNEFLD